MKHKKFCGIPLEFSSRENLYTIDSIPERKGNSYYFLSNDLCYAIPGKVKSQKSLFLGIANPHFFHILSDYSSVNRIGRIIAIDNNPDQLWHFKRIRDLILSCANRIEYLQGLFSVKFNSRAIDLLENFKTGELSVRGALPSDGLYPLEVKIWDNLDYDGSAFYTQYNLEGEKREAGLLINSKTIGDINTYYATILTGSKKEFDHWPFTAAYGSGFLRTEETFTNLKKILSSTPTYIICEDITKCHEDLLLSNRYFPTAFYSSNLFCDYFRNKCPEIEDVISFVKDFGSRVSPELPELDLTIIQDERTAIELPDAITIKGNIKRSYSIHTESFRKVAAALRGNRNIEIVNMPSWIDADNGESKLPNTDYLLFDGFEKLSNDERFSSIFLHILVGHGMEKERFFHIAKKAMKQTDNLIILEHKRDSRDFREGNIGLVLTELRDVLGAESFKAFCPGAKTVDRNILLVYRKDDENRLCYP